MKSEWRSAAWFVVGVMIGAGAIGTWAARKFERTIMATADQTSAQWKSTLAASQQLSDLQRARAEKCEAQFEQGTVLLDVGPGSSAPSVPLFGGLAYLGFAAPPPHSLEKPRWVIPAKIQPIILGDGGTGACVYVDSKSGVLPEKCTPERQNQ